jgi:hypothetical protein
MGMRGLLIGSMMALPFAGAFAVPQALAQERLRSVGEVQYAPRPAEPQTGVIRLQGDDRYLRAMRIESDEGTAEIIELRLIYRDGDEQRVRVRERVRSGQQTSLIRLQEPRALREVEIVYVPEGRVTLILRADTRPAEPPPPPPQQWVGLGCNNVSFLSDQDVLTVGTRDRFSALRLIVQGNDVNVTEMTVRYGDGTRDVYPVRTVIPGGGRTGPITLRGQARRISTIEMLYNSPVLSNIKPKLCVEGLKAREP